MAVNLGELKEVGGKYSEKRRGRRMNSRVQVRLEWKVTPESGTRLRFVRES